MPVLTRFTGRTALVTAGAAGLGWATAKRLADEGATVVVWDRDADAIDRAEGERGERAIGFAQIDLTDGAAIAERAAELLAAHARLDVLVNNAGGSLHTPFHFLELDDEHWRRVMVINVEATVRLTRAVLPRMVEHGYGRIVNLGSKAGRFGSLFAGANYAASKGAIASLTLQLAQEFGPAGITCNAVCPGAILTERVERLLATRKTPEERRQMVEAIPVRRHGAVADVAAAVAYLASEEAGFVTGVMLDLNGGQAMSI